MTGTDIEYSAVFTAGTRAPIRVSFKCDPDMSTKAVEQRARRYLATRTSLPEENWDLDSLMEVPNNEEGDENGG